MITHICLPSGGVNLFKFLGVIQSFIDKKIIDLHNIKCYYGISAGSVLSAILCLGISYDEIIKYFIERTWYKVLNVSKINFMNYFNDKGLLDKYHLIKMVEPLFKSKGFDINTLTLNKFYESTKIKLSIFAIDISKFELKEFNYKNTPDMLLLDAMYFSSCIPCIFKPYEYENKCYLDGGILINSPLDICLQQENINNDNVLAFKTDETRTIIRDVTIKDNFFSYLLKIIDKLHAYSCGVVKNKHCKYFMEIVVLDYSKLDFNKLFHSEEMRRNIYLDGITEGNLFIDNLQSKDD